jgi:polyhydroxyalkanoate synthase
MLSASKREDLVQGPLAVLAAPGALCRTYFTFFDVLRRAQADALGALGLGAEECRYEIAESGPYWRLRDYAVQRTAPSLLIVAAPIKQPYIWDLSPSVSAIRYLLKQGLHIFLLEWLPEGPKGENTGLDEYAEAVSQCCVRIASDVGGQRPFLIGHSLGGTLAAISSALMPERIKGLVLLATPLCFEPGTSQFRDTLVAVVPPLLSGAGRFPGSLLSYIAGVAAPRTFIWSRLMDAALSATDGEALQIHGRVDRWTLDEISLPGKAVDQIMRWLYRENRLCRGTLRVGNTFVGPFSLSVPVLAVVNTADAIAPLASIKPYIDAMPTRDARIIEYPGETGVGLQHVGVLVGRKAYAQVWPEIIAWLKGRS